MIMERIIIVLFFAELTVTVLAGGIAFIRLAVCRKKQHCSNTACPIYHFCNRASHVEKEKEEIRKLKEELGKYINTIKQNS